VAAVFEHVRAAELASGAWLPLIGSIPGVSDGGREALGKLAAEQHGREHGPRRRSLIEPCQGLH
jgi:hypothetical protein